MGSRMALSHLTFNDLERSLKVKQTLVCLDPPAAVFKIISELFKKNNYTSFKKKSVLVLF